MAEILEDMQQLLTMKTSMNSSKLREAMVTYNDNLELAQKSYYRTYLRNCCGCPLSNYFIHYNNCCYCICDSNLF